MLPGANAMEVAELVGGDGGDQPQFPRRYLLRDTVRHDYLHFRVDPPCLPYALRGVAAGDSGGLPFAAELARDAHPHRGGAHLAHRYLRRDAAFGFLAQHADAAGSDSGHRYCGRRRDRRGRERRSHHERGAPLALRGDQEGDGRPGRRPDSHVARAVRRVRPCELPFGHHGTALSPVHHHDRRVGNHLDRRGADAQPRDVRLILRPEVGRPEEPVFRAYQFRPGRRQPLYGRMIGRALAHSRRMFAAFGMVLIGIWLMNKLVPAELHAAGGSGIFHRRAGAPGRGDHRAYARGDRPRDGYLMQDPDVEYVLNVTGSSPRVGTNQARSQLTVILKSWKERENRRTISEVMERVRDELSRYPESKVYLSTPP